MEPNDKDYTSELFRLAAPLLLYLVSFRRRLGRGLQSDEPAVRSELELIFGEIERRAAQDPRLGAIHEKAKYPLVVLADEILLHSDWTWASSWQHSLLEEKYFGTNVGGERIFKIIADLQPRDTELAAVLFAALSLGIKGRYHEEPGQLDGVRSSLFRQLATYLGDLGDQLTPAAYRVEARKAARLSPTVNLARVGVVAAGVVLLYWGVAHLSWGVAVETMRAVVKGVA